MNKRHIRTCTKIYFTYSFMQIISALPKFWTRLFIKEIYISVLILAFPQITSLYSTHEISVREILEFKWIRYNKIKLGKGNYWSYSKYFPPLQWHFLFGPRNNFKKFFFFQLCPYFSLNYANKMNRTLISIHANWDT